MGLASVPFTTYASPNSRSLQLLTLTADHGLSSDHVWAISRYLRSPTQLCLFRGRQDRSFPKHLNVPGSSNDLGLTFTERLARKGAHGLHHPPSLTQQGERYQQQGRRESRNLPTVTRLHQGRDEHRTPLFGKRQDHRAL